MMQTFIATVAFSIGLLAFCAGSWLTIWATVGNKNATEVSAAKMSGYFVTILALISLVFTSYYIAVGVINGDTSSTNYSKWSSSRMPHQMMYKDGGKNKN